MPGPLQAGLALFQQLGTAGLHLIGQFGFGKDKVQGAQNIIVLLDGVCKGSHLRRQLHQDSVDLVFLLGTLFPDGIVQLHHLHGLHKHRGPTGAHIVHQAGDAPFELRLHRHHIPVAPGGDHGVLEYLGIAGRRDDPVQRLPDARGRCADTPPDLPQFRTGCVGDFFFREDRLLNFIL